MKVMLPNGSDTELDETIHLDEKIKKVKELLEEYSVHIENNWYQDSIKFFIDSLANYLIWHKEEGESGHDKEVMSRNKTNRMIRGRKDIPFSNLSQRDNDKLFGEDGGNE